MDNLKNGRGFLFTNQFKKTSTHPDYQGEIKTLEGIVCKINAWVIIKENGGKYLNLSLQVKPQELDKVEYDQ